MRSDRRLWLYTGLAVPEGVGLARRRRTFSSRAPHVLLVGNHTPGHQALLPVLQRLADASKGSIVVDLRERSDLNQWASFSWLDEDLKSFRPSVVMIALSPQECEARDLLESRIFQASAEPLWLSKYGIFAPRTVPAPIHMDAQGIASWAGRIWCAAGFTRSR